MATLGNSTGHRIYVVHATHPIPADDSVFIDYTGFFVEWRVSHKLNNLAMCKGKAALNPSNVSPSGTGTIADDIKAGNYIYVMSGTKLISKFVINKPIFDNTGFCEISGVQSSGRETKTFMHKVNTYKKKFDQEELKTIFFDDSTYAICADSDGDKYLSNLDLDNDTDRMSISIDYENRTGALIKATKLAKKEWVIEHGLNDVTPYNEGDGVRIKNRAGSVGSLKTFILDGENRNAKISSGTTETETAANQIIVKGKDQYGRQINSDIYDATRRYFAETERALDGWLAEDCTATTGISPDATRLKLKPGHGFGPVGDIICGVMYVRIDNEIIRCMLASDELIVWPDGGDTGRGVSLPEGTFCTMPCAHKSGADVILVRDDGVSTSANSYVKLYIDNHSTICDPWAFLRVGKERIGMLDYHDDTWGNYIRMWRVSAILQGDAYSHSSGVPCWRADYNPDNPDIDINSIKVNGLMSATYNDNSANTLDALDKKAYSLLQTKKELTQRIAINVSDPLDAWQDINSNERSPIGSKVTLSETDSINIPAGSYRIVEYEYSWPMPKLILYLNNDDTRIYTTGSYNFVESFDEAESPKRQEPSRSSILLKEGYGSPGNDSVEMYGQKMANIISPREAWDEAGVDPAVYLPTLTMSQDAANSAASVGYVMAVASGGSGGASYWDLDSSGDLRPKVSHDVVPYSSTNDLGIATNPWDRVCATRGRFVTTASGSVAGTFQAPSSSGIAVVEIKTTDTSGGDVLRAGYNTTLGAQSEGWNFRVNDDTVGIYNGPIMFQHENPTPFLKFFNDASNWAGLKQYGGQLMYTDDSGTNWTNLVDMGLWEISGSNIKPKSSYNVIPYNPSGCLGTVGNEWASVYAQVGTFNQINLGNGTLVGNVSDWLTISATTGKDMHLDVDGGSGELDIDCALFDIDVSSVDLLSTGQINIQTSAGSNANVDVCADAKLLLKFYNQTLNFNDTVIYPSTPRHIDLGSVAKAFNDTFSKSFNLGGEVSSVYTRVGHFEQYPATNGALLKALVGDLYLEGYDDVRITAEGTGSAGDIRLAAQNGGDITLDADSTIELCWDTANSRELVFNGNAITPGTANTYNFGSATKPFLNMHSNKFEVYNAAVTKGYISNYSTNSMIVYASAGSLYFRDNSNTTPVSLSTLVAGGTTYWNLSGSNLSPTGAYNVLPYGSGQNLGQTGTSATWNNLYLYSGCHFPYGYIRGDITVDRLDFFCGSTSVCFIDLTLGVGCGRFQSAEFAGVLAGETTERITVKPNGATHGAISAPTGHLYLDGFSDVIFFWANTAKCLVFSGSSIYPDVANTINLGSATKPFLNAHSNKFEVYNAAVTKGYLSKHSTNDIELKATIANLKLNAVADVDIGGVNCDIDVTGYCDIYADGSITIDSGSAHDLQLDAGDDLQLYASDDITMTFGSNDDNLFLNGGSRKIFPSPAQIIDLGSPNAEFDDTYSCDFHGNTNASTCDLAELQFIADDVKPGDVVELCDWDSDEEKYFMEEVNNCKSKPCKHIKYFGMQGKWKKASKGSTKCPSIISTDPGHKMGNTVLRMKLFKEGRMNYVALSGSIPFVFIDGKFAPGDMIVSAGDGKAMVDNAANSNQVIGYTKRTGENERCEVWVR